MKNKLLVVSAFLLFVCTAVFAADVPPLAVMKQTANQMIAALDKNKAQIKNNPRLIDSIVRRILLPQVDVEGMSRSVIGRIYWNQATPAVRAEFKKLFVQIVIDTYSAPLASYSGETIQFFPVRDYSPSSTRLQVSSQIIRPNGPPIAVSYRLVRLGNNWKIYDFSVEGISMVQSFSSQFANVLQQGGLNALLQQLKNRQRNQ